MLRNVAEGCGKLQRRWPKPAYENLKFYQDICEISMSGQYIKSLYKMEREGTWKVPGARLRKKVTFRNLQKLSKFKTRSQT